MPKPLPPPIPRGSAPAPPRRWARRGLVIFLVVANVAIFGSLGALWLAAREVTSSVSTVPAEELGLDSVPQGTNEPRVFLLIGSDSRADLPDDFTGFGNFGGQRADVIMLVQLLPGEKRVQMLSLPRDLRVEVDGKVGRINAIFNSGGAAIVSAVSDYAGVPIHHYLQVDFAGFAGIVDAMGGIEMTFPYAVRDLKSKLEVGAGPQVLDGKTALAMARSRHFEEFRDGQWVAADASDIGRTRRQQDLLMALITQMDRPSSLEGFRGLVRALGEFVTTDDAFNEDELLQLVWAMRSVGPGDIDSLTLPVKGLEEGGVSYVVPIEPDAGLALAAFQAGEPMSAAREGKGRVEVQNGNGTDGAATSVAELLGSGGWEVTRVTNSDLNNYQTTLVVARPKNLPLAEAVVQFLGYGRVEVGAVPAGVEMVVIVGADAGAG
jgi:LCP family protein required for cell wall assembly